MTNPSRFKITRAGVYTFDLSFLNRFGPEAGHFNVYLLREVRNQPAPEPATLTLFGASLFGVGLSRRRRRTGTPAANR